jgi:NADPH-dependent curcumin reductase CurA
MESNRRWVLHSRPPGLPTADDFRLIIASPPEPADGEVLVRTLYVSVDPYIRGRMRNVRSYVKPLEIGEVIDGAVVGRVVASRAPGLAEGDLVTGRLGWQDYAAVAAAELARVPADGLPPSTYLGALGMTGLTAYFGLLDVGALRAGETVLVSGAAGAVGSAVGQIAKIKGARAVGVAGSDEKISFLKSIGFDAAVNYRTATNLRRAVRDACVDGVDVYFDNVGGEISDAAVTALNRRGRVVVCGQISIANRDKTETGPRNWLYFLVNRARLEGFLVMDYADRYAEAIREMTPWVKSGKLRHRETIVEGLENAPRAFLGLFRGDNVGKMLVKVSD